MLGAYKDPSVSSEVRSNYLVLSNVRPDLRLERAGT